MSNTRRVAAIGISRFFATVRMLSIECTLSNVLSRMFFIECALNYSRPFYMPLPIEWALQKRETSSLSKNGVLANRKDCAWLGQSEKLDYNLLQTFLTYKLRLVDLRLVAAFFLSLRQNSSDGVEILNFNSKKKQLTRFKKKLKEESERSRKVSQVESLQRRASKRISAKLVWSNVDLDVRLHCDLQLENRL